MTPRVTIIVPHFDRARLVRETIASVRAQTLSEWELLLVDDGSSPEERNALDHFPDERIRILDRHDGDKGPSRCRNLGAREAKAEFLLFLDSDDLLAPTCLENRLAAATAAPDHDLWVFPAGTFTERPGDRETLWGEMRPGGDDAARFAGGDAPWHTSSPLWRRSSFRKIGGFNENIVYGDDADVHLRAILEPLRIRQHPDSPPDIYVRRSRDVRITNTLNEELLHSRLVRLEEGTRLLTSRSAGPRLLAIWEGQHFIEAEFLLFRVDDRLRAERSIRAVLHLWRRDFTPPYLRWLLVRSYFRIALATRHRAYLPLRVARRFAMLVLPSQYFPQPT